MIDAAILSFNLQLCQPLHLVLVHVLGNWTIVEWLHDEQGSVERDLLHHNYYSIIISIMFCY